MIKLHYHTIGTHPDTPAVKDIPLKIFNFPGGEVQVRIEGDLHEKYTGYYIVRADLVSSDDILSLMLLMNALRMQLLPDFGISLDLRYLPYARQDRDMGHGEALSVKVMCNIINSLNFNSVRVWDCHSPVGLALLDRVYNVPQVELFKMVLPYTDKNTILVSPDAGATKKTEEIAKRYGLRMVQAHKVRSTDTGEIQGIKVDAIPEHGNLLIVDDICDGGRTFTELAQVLRTSRWTSNEKIHLYVTHGIFSNPKGVNVFDGLIDHVYTANPFPKVDLNNPLLTKVEHTLCRKSPLV